VVWSTPSP